MPHLLMDCQKKIVDGYCEAVAFKVSPSFCEQTCKGVNHFEWRRKLETPNDEVFAHCGKCKWYHACGMYCNLLTRHTDLAGYLSENPCPLEKKRPMAVGFTPQPKVHPARNKPIFLRADKKVIDIVDLFHGQTAFIIGGGKSFQEIDQSQLQQAGILTMALNNSAHKFRPTMWTGQDPQYRFMPSIWDDPSIMKFSLLDYRFRRHWDSDSDAYANHDIRSHPNMFFHRRHSNFKAEKWIDEDRVVWGTPRDLPEGGHGARSVLVAGLHILYFLGFHKVFLVGVDFKMTADSKYWFDEERTRGAIRNNGRVFHHVNKHLIDLQPHILKAGFNVFNCNPDSALKAFPYYPLDKAIEDSLISTAESTKGYYVKRA